MKDFDNYLKRKAMDDKTDIPKNIKSQIEETLDSLPEKTTSYNSVWKFSRVASIAACFIFVTLFLLPNISPTYAQALEQIPVIGKIVKVVTIRNYFYSDDYHEMNINVPEVENGGNKAFDTINNDINELTNTLVNRFYEDLETIGDNAHGAVYVDYDVVTDTDNWFTLKIRVFEAAGSSNTYYKYYHINKMTGDIVKLGDMAKDDNFYAVLEQEIKRQMREEMEKDDSVIYWLDDSAIGKDYVSVSEDHNFYWNENGDLVIPFDKYEVAPGAMGTPEFTIDKEIVKNIVKPEFEKIIK